MGWEMVLAAIACVADWLWQACCSRQVRLNKLLILILLPKLTWAFLPLFYLKRIHHLVGEKQSQLGAR
jgi:hypothetical protein